MAEALQLIFIETLWIFTWSSLEAIQSVTFYHLHVDEADPLLVPDPGRLASPSLRHHVADGDVPSDPGPGLLVALAVHGVDVLPTRAEAGQAEELVHQIQVGVGQGRQGYRLTPAACKKGHRLFSVSLQIFFYFYWPLINSTKFAFNSSLGWTVFAVVVQRSKVMTRTSTILSLQTFKQFRIYFHCKVKVLSSSLH